MYSKEALSDIFQRILQFEQAKRLFKIIEEDFLKEASS